MKTERISNSYQYETTLGTLTIAECNGKITGIYFGDYQAGDICRTELTDTAAEQLREYLSGARKKFDLCLDAQGTEFQKKVWAQLCRIPYGETRSYKQIADAAGYPKAARAVGLANNRNPIAVVVPCHRVIGANGKLVGYAGGLDIKTQLLELEQNNK